MDLKLFFLTLIFLIILGLLFYWIFKLLILIIKKRKYTREYFAFFGLNTFIGICALVLSYIFANQSLLFLINSFIKLICKFLDKQAEEYLLIISPPTFTNIFIALVILYFVHSIILYIFKNWTGSISQRQAEEESKREIPGILSDFIAYINKESKLTIHTPQKELIDFSLTLIEEEKLPWHIQSAELLSLISKQYKIDIEKDWFSEHNTFISKFGNTDEPIAVLSLIEKPNKLEIANFIKFTKSIITNKNCYKYLIVVQNSIEDKHNISFDGLLIEYRSKEDLLNKLIDFSSYKYFIKKKFETDEIIQGYPICLNQTYTTPNGKIKIRTSATNEFEHIGNLENYVESWMGNTKINYQLAILGEYGQGKSVFAQRICYLILEGRIISDRIPILIELRGKFPKQYLEKMSLFSDWASSFGIDPRALMKLHINGKLLLIFEGFDEMELVGDYNMRLDHFRKLWEFANNNSKIIITGRPNFFLNDNELKVLLRTSEEYQSSSYSCEELHIESFNIDQISNALRFCEPEIVSEIVDTIKNQGEKSSFFDLISRPTHLFLTSLVWKERLSKLKLNINSALVYKEFLNHCYSRQNKKEINSPLSIYERAFFMQGIAVQMAKSSVFTNQIGQRKLKEIIFKLYDDFPEAITKNQAAIPTNNTPLKKRHHENHNEETVFLDIRSCGVLVRDLSTFDTFKFAHKSFMEYLISDYYLFHLLNRRNKSTDLDCENIDIELISKNSIKKSLEIELNDIYKTPEIFNFITQLLCNKINIDETFNDEKKAKILFKLIYPYTWIPIRIALFLRPFLSLNFNGKALIVSIFIIFVCFIYRVYKDLYELQNTVKDYFVLSTSIILLISISLILSRIFREKVGTDFINMIVFPVDESSEFKFQKRTVDYDNLLLWFCSCIEIGISNEILKKILSETRYNLFLKMRADIYN